MSLVEKMRKKEGKLTAVPAGAEEPLEVPALAAGAAGLFFPWTLSRSAVSSLIQDSFSLSLGAQMK